MNNDQSANKREKKREDDRKRNSAQHGRVNCNIYQIFMDGIKRKK